MCIWTHLSFEFSQANFFPRSLLLSHLISMYATVKCKLKFFCLFSSCQIKSNSRSICLGVCSVHFLSETVDCLGNDQFTWFFEQMIKMFILIWMGRKRYGYWNLHLLSNLEPKLEIILTQVIIIWQRKRENEGETERRRAKERKKLSLMQLEKVFQVGKQNSFIVQSKVERPFLCNEQQTNGYRRKFHSHNFS